MHRNGKCYLLCMQHPPCKNNDHKLNSKKWSPVSLNDYISASSKEKISFNVNMWIFIVDQLVNYFFIWNMQINTDKSSKFSYQVWYNGCYIQSWTIFWSIYRFFEFHVDVGLKIKIQIIHFENWKQIMVYLQCSCKDSFFWINLHQLNWKTKNQSMA